MKIKTCSFFGYRNTELYDENYNPPMRKYSKRSICSYQPKSGTALTYKYALQKKKCIHNFF